MVKVHGVWFLPSMAEEVVRSFPQVEEYRLVRVEDGIGVRDVRLELELAEASKRADAERLLADVAVIWKRRLGFRPQLAIVPSGSLPRFEAKARRVVREPSGEGPPR